MGQVTVTQQEGYMEYHFMGTFDDESIYRYFRDLWTAADYEPVHRELYDLRHADLKLLTGTVIKKITFLNRELHAEAPQLRHALLATQDLQYGFSRMITTLSENRNPNVRVFRDRDEAVRWISSEGSRES